MISLAEESKANTAHSKDNGEDGSSAAAVGAQQQDWSILWSCFENPLSLLSVTNGLPKGMKEMVCNAVSEMRRYYSRKVIDVLIKVTRVSLDLLRKRFVVAGEDGNVAALSDDDVRPIFLVHSTLMIPNVAIRPTLDELQDALIAAGKNITGVAKGVAQWTSGKDVSFCVSIILLLLKKSILFTCSHRKAMCALADVMKLTTNERVAVNCIVCNRKSGRRCRT